MKNKCLNCKKETKNKKFCSLKCHHINRVKEQGVWNKGMSKEELSKHYPDGWHNPIMWGKNNPKYKNKIQLVCLQCKKRYLKNESVSVYSKFCSKKCKLQFYSIAHSSKGNPNYKNGITIYRRNIKDFCEKCNKNKILIVHHKDKDRTNNKLSNLMTLCVSCHNKKKTHNG